MTTVTVAERPGWGFEEGDELVPGRTVLDTLGGGSRYEALLVWDERRHALMVAKVLRPHLVDDARAVLDLAAEAEALEALQHPIILRGFEAVLEGDRPHLLVEHLEGPTLRWVIRRTGPLGLEQMLPLALHLASALHYLHGEGWVHLDVKPDNVILGVPPRLIDLSVARPVEAAALIHRPVGTDGYMAPEQSDPEAHPGAIGPAADVYGLGVTLRHAWTGHRRARSCRRTRPTRWPSSSRRRWSPTRRLRPTPARDRHDARAAGRLAAAQADAHARADATGALAPVAVLGQDQLLRGRRGARRRRRVGAHRDRLGDRGGDGDLAVAGVDRHVLALGRHRAVHAGLHARGHELVEQVLGLVLEAQDLDRRADLDVGERHALHAGARLDRVAVRAGLRVADRGEHPLLEHRRHRVLQALGLLVHLVPRDAEDVGEEALDEAVAADDALRVRAGPPR